jgi:FAD/FMN-containing dehydrogenase
MQRAATVADASKERREHDMSTSASTGDDTGILVNDIHSRLNSTAVHRLMRPTSVAQIQDAVRAARAEGRAISIAGGRHAMGGQQFGADTLLLDLRAMNRVLTFDAEAGEVEIEAGIQWPELVAELARLQEGRASPWGIVQKQTGADRFSIGGSLSANIHSRGLTLRPIIADVASFTLVDAWGEVRQCSRAEHPELFRLAIGGYGLFGVIAAVRLRLARRTKVERIVEVGDIDTIIAAFDARIVSGCTYGDFQFAIDPDGEDFLREGVFSCYRPVPDDTPIPAGQPALSREDWQHLLVLAHTDKRAGVDAYKAHYLRTNGAIAWSDLHQMTDYVDGYHLALDTALGAAHPATEMITELYVPRAELAAFMTDARADFRANAVDVIYGTVRLVERDTESFLAWAREPWACVIFNLHVVHTAEGLAHAAAAFRRLIDLAIARGGSYYLTYHRWATRAQVEACYPQFGAFLRRKLAHDPEERFQSEWYRHYRAIFADELAASLRDPAPATSSVRPSSLEQAP